MKKLKAIYFVFLITLVSSHNVSAFISEEELGSEPPFNSLDWNSGYSDEPILYPLPSALYVSQSPTDTSVFAYQENLINGRVVKSSSQLSSKSSYTIFNDPLLTNTIGFVIYEAVSAYMSYGVATGYGNDAVGGTQVFLGIASGGQLPFTGYTLLALGGYNLLNDVEREQDEDGDRKINEDVFWINFVGMNLLNLEYTLNMSFFGPDSSQKVYFYPDNKGDWFINYNYKF
ncbi:hypothetical protein L4C37_12040 [Vibrio kagoshimensis]|uniref:hypothetical protein n=1 Tax=Vibrio kagoshimensis TaxID=2910244 RepID=UPI003D231DF3